MLPVGLGYCVDEGVVSDLPVLSSPGRHVGLGVGPADSDAALILSLIHI